MCIGDYGTSSFVSILCYSTMFFQESILLYTKEVYFRWPIVVLSDHVFQNNEMFYVSAVQNSSLSPHVHVDF